MPNDSMLAEYEIYISRRDSFSSGAPPYRQEQRGSKCISSSWGMKQNLWGSLKTNLFLLDFHFFYFVSMYSLPPHLFPLPFRLRGAYPLAYLGLEIRQLLLVRPVIILSVIALPDFAQPLLALRSSLYICAS
jgi:hypothetical protein